MSPVDGFLVGWPAVSEPEGGGGLWRLAVDTGGTFTDCLAVDPEGRTHRAKVLSSSSLRGAVAERLGARRLRVEGAWSVPDGFFRGFELRVLGAGGAWKVADSTAERGEIELEEDLSQDLAAPGRAVELRSDEEAPVLAARLVTGTPREETLPAMEIRLATTRGTNALLERRGAKTLLLITKGLGDLLDIGTQQRLDLFALDVRKPEPLAKVTLEVEERLDADGAVVKELDIASLDRLLGKARSQGVESVAVAFMHAYRNPTHEMRVGILLAERGWRHVSLSSALAPLIKLLPRAETAVVDAYLSPVVGDYLERVVATVVGEGGGQGGRVLAMTSAGGLVGASSFRPKDSLLSGPAGGVIGAARAAARSGFDRVLAFDMGGTSTDVARYGGTLEHRFESEVGGVHLMAPALAIESVAAGGGSICRFEGQRLTVGPQSAGAAPGPACYGAGGPLTVTDANLLLGRLDPDRFEIPLDRGAAERVSSALLGELPEPQEVYLAGLIRIADERMAEAIRRISVRRGYRPSDHALVGFGGAGGQHACAVASLLGIGRVLIPADAGLLSAAGVAWANLERFAQKQLPRPLDSFAAGELEGLLDELFREASEALKVDGVPSAGVRVGARRLDLRVKGQETSLALDADPLTSLARRFLARYEEVFGYLPEGAEIEVEAIRVVAVSGGEFDDSGRREDDAWVQPDRSQRCFLDDSWHEVALFDRERLAAGARIAGPSLVTERHSTTLVADGWCARLDGYGALILTAANERSDAPPAPGGETGKEAGD
ncbi:MAG TPA: hydantoinase/oxoprolinase family protein, partial [Thermoanaerobaculia bacterium]|nr:hydantoinase/oxoprolinase family protein [Thermoanaerobaculia bacterium]